MRTVAILSAAALLLIGFAAAQEVVNEDDIPKAGVTTKVFADYKFHEIPTLSTTGKAGLGVGFGIFSILILFSLVKIAIDEYERHVETNKKVVTLRNRMNELDMNVENIDK